MKEQELKVPISKMQAIEYETISERDMLIPVNNQYVLRILAWWKNLKIQKKYSRYVRNYTKMHNAIKKVNNSEPKPQNTLRPKDNTRVQNIEKELGHFGLEAKAMTQGVVRVTNGRKTVDLYKKRYHSIEEDKRGTYFDDIKFLTKHFNIRK